MTAYHLHLTPEEQTRMNELWSRFSKVVNAGHGATFPTVDPAFIAAREKTQREQHEAAVRDFAQMPPPPTLRDRVMYDEEHGIYDAHRHPQLSANTWTETGPLAERQPWLFKRFDAVLWRGQPGEVMGARFYPNAGTVMRPDWAVEDAKRRSKKVAVAAVAVYSESDFKARGRDQSLAEPALENAFFNTPGHSRHEYTVLVGDTLVRAKEQELTHAG